MGGEPGGPGGRTATAYKGGLGGLPPGLGHRAWK